MEVHGLATAGGLSGWPLRGSQSHRSSIKRVSASATITVRSMPDRPRRRSACFEDGPVPTKCARWRQRWNTDSRYCQTAHASVFEFSLAVRFARLFRCRGQCGLDQLCPLQVHVGLQHGPAKAAYPIQDHVHISSLSRTKRADVPGFISP